MQKPSYSTIKGEPSSDSQTMAYIPDRIFRSLTVGISLSTMTVAFFIRNVETILALNGALMGSFIGMV